jgi:hypothetical protein
MSINYFRRKRTTALISIEKLIGFIKDLHNKYPNIGFGNTASEVLRVKEILSRANDRCLTDIHIDNFRRFGNVLTNNLIFGLKYFHSPNIQPKLLKFWTLCENTLYAPILKK